MIVDWKVMSARDAASYCNKTQKQSAIIISINNSFEMGTNLFCNSKNKVKEILKLYFDDVRKQELYLSKEGPFSVPLWLDKYGRCYCPIEAVDCKKIHEFIMKYHKMEKEFLLIVHCGAGISRSSATMAAIWRYLFKDDSIIFNNPYYKPNKDVYNSLLKYFYEQEGIDNMEVSLESLRFGVNDTPWGYSPNTSLKTNANNEKNSLIFVPSVGMVNLIPDLSSAFIEVSNSANRIRDSLPFFRFTVAKTVTNKTDKKVQFFSMLSSDGQYKEHEKTVGFKIVDFYEKNRFFPTLEVKTEDYNTLKGSFTKKEYIISFLNRESNYFSSLALNGIFKEKYKLNETDPKNIIVEYEYTFGEYKTWVYEKFPCKNYSKEAFSGVTFLMDAYNHLPLLECTRKIKDDVAGDYEIYMLDSNNMPAILTYTEEEWNNDREFYKHLTGIRFANWSND